MEETTPVEAGGTTEVTTCPGTLIEVTGSLMTEELMTPPLVTKED